MNPTKIKNLLKDILTDGEIKFYLQSLEGPASIQEISKKTKLNRSGCYEIMESLTAKGLVYQEIKKRGRVVVAEHPNKLVQLIGNKQRRLRRNELELKDYLPELLSVFDVGGFKPRVRFYEGKEGYLQIHEHILENEMKEILCLGDTSHQYEIFGKKFDKEYYIPKRLEKNVKFKMLVFEDEFTKNLKQTDKKELRETKFLDKKNFKFSGLIYIYGGCVALFTPTKENFALVIESLYLSEMLRNIFNNMWQNSPSNN